MLNLDRTIAALAAALLTACSDSPESPPPPLPPEELCATPLAEQLAAGQTSPELERALAERPPTLEERRWAALTLVLGIIADETTELPQAVFDVDLDLSLEETARQYPAFFAPCSQIGTPTSAGFALTAAAAAGDGCGDECRVSLDDFPKTREFIVKEARKQLYGATGIPGLQNAVDFVKQAVFLALLKVACNKIRPGMCSFGVKDILIAAVPAALPRQETDRILAGAAGAAGFAATVASGPAGSILAIAAGVIQAIRFYKRLKKDLAGAARRIYECNIRRERFCGVGDPEGTWDCGESGASISYARLCNGRTDCAGGGDEDQSGCELYCGQEGMFACGMPSSCASIGMACNGVKECVFDSDESAEACQWRAERDPSFIPPPGPGPDPGGGSGCPSVYDGTYAGPFAYEYDTTYDNDGEPIAKHTGSIQLSVTLQCAYGTSAGVVLRATHASSSAPELGCTAGCVPTNALGFTAVLPGSPPASSSAGHGLILDLPSGLRIQTYNVAGALIAGAGGESLASGPAAVPTHAWIPTRMPEVECLALRSGFEDAGGCCVYVPHTYTYQDSSGSHSVTRKFSSCTRFTGWSLARVH